MSKELKKYASESPIGKLPVKPLKLVISDKAVGRSKLSNEVQGELDRIDDLQRQINSIETSGLALSQGLGNDPAIGISQKAITEEILRLHDRINEITGEITMGIDMIVSPDYYVGYEGCDVHILAMSYGADRFDYIAFYINNSAEPAIERTSVNTVDETLHIEHSATIKCVARIMGKEFIKEKTVSQISSFWAGAGSKWQDIMDTSHAVSISDSSQYQIPVTVNQGDYLFIILSEEEAWRFNRATFLGGLGDISFSSPQTVVLSGQNYKVFTSLYNYQAGNYTMIIYGN